MASMSSVPFFRPSLSLFFTLALAACGNNSAMMGTPDLAMPDLASGGFQTASHTAFPQLTLHTTKVFPAPQLVSISYSDFPFADKMEAFGDFMVGSQWLITTGAEYGVGHGTHLQKVRLTEKAPAAATDSDTVSYLKKLAAAGTIPAPSATNNQLIYMVYFPMTSKVDDGSGGILCQDGYLGYHASDNINGIPFEYAIIPDCDGPTNASALDDLTSTVSHEFIESATDPDDAWYLDVADADPWVSEDYEETADLCQDDDNVMEGPWAFQRSWSNAAAKAGTTSPCVPIPAGEIYMNVTVDPPMVITLAQGKSTTFTLTGWSTAPLSEWALTTTVADGADFDPAAKLEPATPSVANGTSVKITLTVPALDLMGQPVSSGELGAVQVYNGTGGNYWPVAIALP